MTLRTGTVIAALMVGTGVVFAETVPVNDDAVKGVLDDIKSTVSDIKSTVSDINGTIGNKSDDADQKTLIGKLQKQIEYSQDKDGKAEVYKDQQLKVDTDGWKYLDKAEYKDVMSGGVTNCDSIKTGLQDLAKNETAEQALERTAKQVAMNRALADLIYKNAHDRIDKLNALTKKIDDAGDPKEKEELQLRIAAEQMMLANEQTKIMALDLEQKAMVAIDEQIKKEIIVKKLSGGTDTWVTSTTGTGTGTATETGNIPVTCS